MLQRDKQERRASSCFTLGAHKLLQSKCKREDVILVTIIFYAEYVSFDNHEAELQAKPDISRHAQDCASCCH